MSACPVWQDVWFGDAPRRRAVHVTRPDEGGTRVLLIPPPGLAPEQESIACGLDALARDLQVWALDLSQDESAPPAELVTQVAGMIADRWGRDQPLAVVGLGPSCASVAAAAPQVCPRALALLEPDLDGLEQALSGLAPAGLADTPLLVLQAGIVAEGARADTLATILRAFPLASIVRTRSKNAQALAEPSPTLVAAWLVATSG